MVSALVYITACSIRNLLSLACFMRGAAWCDDMGMDKTWGNLSIDSLYSYSSFRGNIESTYSVALRSSHRNYVVSYFSCIVIESTGSVIIENMITKSLNYHQSNNNYLILKVPIIFKY